MTMVSGSEDPGGSYHCVVVGTGPGGLACAIYLARFNLRVLVVGREDQRARNIPRTWNVPGHPDGILGPELLFRCREQANRYGATIVDGWVECLDGHKGAFHARLEDGRDFRAHNVVLATGVRDVLPDIPDVERYYGQGLRVCSVCDGYETRDMRLAVFGTGAYVARHALFLATWTDRITVMMNGQGKWEDIGEGLRREMEAAGIRHEEGRVVEVVAEGAEIRALCTEDGETVEVDRAYAAIGKCTARSRLARDLGAAVDADGYIKVDANQCTTVPGMYAVGDVVNQDYSQIAIAMGQAAVAAIHMHNADFTAG